MGANFQPGQLLVDVLRAEERADGALRYPELSLYADAVVAVAQRIRDPLLVAVGVDGQRLLGAVEIRCEGQLEQSGWCTIVKGREVLLVAVAAVSVAEVSLAAVSARRSGARRVHACAVDALAGEHSALDSFTRLDLRTHKARRRRPA
jgi:hypothetical protein